MMKQKHWCSYFIVHDISLFMPYIHEFNIVPALSNSLSFNYTVDMAEWQWMELLIPTPVCPWMFSYGRQPLRSTQVLLWCCNNQKITGHYRGSLCWRKWWTHQEGALHWWSQSEVTHQPYRPSMAKYRRGPWWEIQYLDLFRALVLLAHLHCWPKMSQCQRQNFQQAKYHLLLFVPNI